MALMQMLLLTYAPLVTALALPARMGQVQIV
jgi:hypothetical protein